MNRCLLFGLMLSTFITYASEEAVLNAARTGDLALLRANIYAAENAQNTCGDTPLDVAIQNKHEEVALCLIERVPSLVHKHRRDGVTLLYAAVINELYSLALKCIEAGADVNIVVCAEGFEEVALYRAVYSGHVPTVLALLQAGARVDLLCGDFYAETVLHVAVRRDYISVMRLLLRYGVDVDAKDGKGRTALDVACAMGRVRSVILLVIEAGALCDELVCGELLSASSSFVRRHGVIRFLTDFWHQGIHNALEGLEFISTLVEIEPGRNMPIDTNDPIMVHNFKKWCFDSADNFLKEKMALLDPDRELPKDLKKLVISFVAAQEDLNAALRFVQQDGQEAMVQFLRSIGATDASSTA